MEGLVLFGINNIYTVQIGEDQYQCRIKGKTLKNKDKYLNITLPLDKMTNEEKIIIIEKIWEDLYKKNDIKSPLWHRDILEKRKKDIENGEGKILDWNEERNNIRNSF